MNIGISKQAKIAAGYRLHQQLINAQIHTLLLSAIDPTEISEEELMEKKSIVDSDSPTHKDMLLRQVAHLRVASNLTVSKLKK
jgi:hypothetical protein